MAPGTQAAQLRSLFRSFMREGRRFNNYNIREYVVRRAKAGFREAVSGEQQARLLATAQQDLAALKRQSLVYGLYARPVKNVLELDAQKAKGSQGK